jgi:hypothetical protein
MQIFGLFLEAGVSTGWRGISLLVTKKHFHDARIGIKILQKMIHLFIFCKIKYQLLTTQTLHDD